MNVKNIIFNVIEFLNTILESEVRSLRKYKDISKYYRRKQSAHCVKYVMSSIFIYNTIVKLYNY